MRVRCEVCRKRFEPGLREEATPDSGLVGLFDCPHCQTRYESYVVDQEGARIRTRLGVTKDTNEAQALQARLKAHVKRGRGRIAA